MKGASVRARLGASLTVAMLLVGCTTGGGSGTSNPDVQEALHDDRPVNQVGDAGDGAAKATTTALETFTFRDGGGLDTAHCPGQIGVAALFDAEVALTAPNDWACVYILYGDSGQDLGSISVKEVNVQGVGWYTVQDFTDGDVTGALTFTERPEYGAGAVEARPPADWPGGFVWLYLPTPAGPAVEIEVSYAGTNTDAWVDGVVTWVQASW